jgi:3-deoxy-D-manno-octulosonic-acid transferase
VSKAFNQPFSECLPLAGKRDSKRSLFIWFYRIIFAPVALILSPKYLLKMKRRGDYQGAISMRMGIRLDNWPKTEGKQRIWIQAVSLGEMLVIERLIRELADNPNTEILLTTTTSTGLKLAREKYSNICDRICYFPMDFWPFSRKFWQRMRPDLAICAETELWPEHMRQAAMAGVPMVLVNARLSDRSFKIARALNWMYRGHLRYIDRVLAISDQDAHRFQTIGVDTKKISVTGNLKVDVSMGEILGKEERRAMKEKLGLGRGFVLLGSSTWPGEEEALISAFRRLRKDLSDCRLLIVPRHAERRVEIRTTLDDRAQGFTYRFKSIDKSSEEVDILVADTSGELRTLATMADLAFVGKSLPPHREGQTPIECGLLGVPVIFGPGMSNFRSVTDGMLQAGAAVRVRDADELEERIVALAADSSARAEISQNQERWAQRSRGALDNTLRELRAFLP